MTIATGAVIPPLPRPIRVAVVDDHEIVARGVTGLALERPEVMQVVITAGSSAELFNWLDHVSAEVMLLDLHLNDGSAPADTIRRSASAVFAA